jgi:16S rRNA (uracil1498-N3)-methyltransferase
MHRFYLPPARCAGEVFQLDGREAHHALDVLRLQRGEAVTVLDGAGREFLCETRAAAAGRVDLAVREKKVHAPLPCAVTLLAGIPKGKIFEDIVEKATELGATRVVPLLTERTVVQLDAKTAAAKVEKWRQVAIESIKQCGSPWLPQIELPATPAQAMARVDKCDLSLVGSLQTARRHPREWLEAFRAQHHRPPQSVAVWIGPEGDFTPGEMSAIEAAGARPVSLGRLVLRVETAAIYCLSVLNYELQPA